MRPRVRKRVLTIALIVAALYFISFAVLVLGGGYVWVRSGQFRPVNNLAAADILVWQPRFGAFYEFRNASGKDSYQSDYVGCLYSPLILLWQSCMAPSIRTVNPDGSTARPLRSFPRRNQLHPSVLREVPEMEQTLGLTWEQVAAKFTSGQ